MFLSLLLSLPSCSSLVPPAAAAVPARLLPVAQDPDLKEKLKAFADLLKEDGMEAEVIGQIDAFTKQFRADQAEIEGIDEELDLGDGNPKELAARRKALVKEQAALAEAVFSTIYDKHHKAITEDNMAMWKAAAFALGQMGETGADYLWTIFLDKKKKFRKEPDFLGLCLEQLGYTHAYAAYTGELADLLDHHEYLFIAKAADALAQFGDAPGELRRGATETLVKLLAEYYEATITDKDDVEAQEKYRKVGRSMMNALEALTGVSQSKPLDWVSWWNDHKKKNDETWAED